MPRRSPHGTLWWIAAGTALVVALAILAAVQLSYLPRSWSGLAWLLFLGLPVCLLIEWLVDALAVRAKGRSWRWRASAYAGLVVILMVVVGLALSIAPSAR
jgi:hypothetical protein